MRPRTQPIAATHGPSRSSPAASAAIEPVNAADLESAWAIGMEFPDQDFSMVDRTSFAVMLRLGVHRVAAFDEDFAVFSLFNNKQRAFEILR